MPTPSRRVVLVAALVSALCAFAPPVAAQAANLGLLVNDERAERGYTLVAPMWSRQTYLIGPDGHVVNSWTGSGRPGLMAYLLPNGHLLRAVGLQPAVHANWFNAIGGGGRFEEHDWDGNLVWSMDWMDATKYQHHDFKVMPNGNVLFISWSWKSRNEAIAAGRNPARVQAAGFWPDSIHEVRPTPPTGGVVVWEWHVWDHLIQDFDPTKANYGVVADHPELIDINVFGDDGPQDFNHLNGIDYDPELDQIVFSSRAFNEIYVIDHSTTTAEAASHSGGRQGRGGDILYRWGNPQHYGRGGPEDRLLFNQHDSQWVPPGHPGAGNLLMFNNGQFRADGQYSSVEEIVTPVNASGGYDIAPGEAFGPPAAHWTWTGTPRSSFFSPIIAGVQRLPGGNTLACEGTTGSLVQIAPTGEIVWRWVNPVLAAGPLAQGDPIPDATMNNNAVFKARWYPPDHPGLAGRPLDPGDLLEIHEAPPPVPDGRGGTQPVRVSKRDAGGAMLGVTWDAVSCTAANYKLFHGRLEDVAFLGLEGSLCRVGTSGSLDWNAPAGNLYFLMAGMGTHAMYESSWGFDSFGRERHGTEPSRSCGATTKSLGRGCP